MSIVWTRDASIRRDVRQAAAHMRKVDACPADTVFGTGLRTRLKRLGVSFMDAHAGASRPIPR
ncbi:MAG: hypothetical protein M3540_01675 [Actinomycetota bacterium]|nr:hypothetical protein [Actinomycetota bacterium]